MEELPQLLENVPLAMHHTMWFMRVGAPTYFTSNLKQFFNLFSTQNNVQDKSDLICGVCHHPVLNLLTATCGAI
jgi:hypothetical protein